jgi:hypothetical protein
MKPTANADSPPALGTKVRRRSDELGCPRYEAVGGLLGQRCARGMRCSRDGVGMSPGILDVQATLTFGDIGGVHYELPVHVHLCADVQRTLPPCF